MLSTYYQSFINSKIWGRIKNQDSSSDSSGSKLRTQGLSIQGKTPLFIEDHTGEVLYKETVIQRNHLLLHQLMKDLFERVLKM